MRQTFFALLLSLALFSSVTFAQSGTWSNFHACSVGCGGGTTYRDCILNGAQVDYSNCAGGANASTAECNTVPCGTIIGVWSAIHACDAQCMTYRDCLVNGSIADNSYCEGESVQICTIPPCEDAAFAGVWSDFSNCTLADNATSTCGAGIETRDCLVNGTVADVTNCRGGAFAETRNCSTCTGTWSDWSDCTRDDNSTSSCGAGVETRDCLVNGTASNFTDCEGGEDASTRDCSTCEGTWSDWGSCLVEGDDDACGTGFQSRDCLINLTVVSSTNCEGGEEAASRTCVVDCTGTWSDWSDCTLSDNSTSILQDNTTCGAGTQTRDCLVNGTSSNFTDCEGGEDAATRNCSTCTGTWSDWSNCTADDDNSTTCTTGFQTRDCLVNGTVSNVTDCEGGEAASNRSCTFCPGTWSDWSNCTSSDNSTSILQDGSDDNTTCTAGFQTRDCLVNGTASNFTACEGGEDASVRNCSLCAGTWSDWSNCTATCGAGIETRDCLVNGTVSNFTDCEGGEDASVRNCTGTDCGEFVGVWGAFHACNASCGGGVTYRDCLVNGTIQRNNSLCEGGDAAATRECNTVPCGTIIGTWSAFHACNASCGGGSTYRDCLVNGSISDPSYCEGNSTAACNTQACESSSSTGAASSSSSTGDVVFAGVWSSVHACPVSCGGGTTYRDCLVDGQQADYSNCEGESTRPCNTQAC